MSAGQTPAALSLKKEKKEDEEEEEEEEESSEMGEEEMMEWALRTLERTQYLSDSDTEEEKDKQPSKSSNPRRNGVHEGQKQQATTSSGVSDSTKRKQNSQRDVSAETLLPFPSTAVSHTSVNSEQTYERLCFTPAVHVEPSEDPLALPVKTEQPTSHQSCMKQERVSDVPCQTPPQPQTSSIKAEALPSEALPSCMLRQTLPSQSSAFAQPPDPSPSCNESDMSRQRLCEREGAALDSPLLPPAVKTEPSDGLPHTTAAFEGQSEDQLTVTVKTENEVQSNESLMMEVDIVPPEENSLLVAGTNTNVLVAGCVVASEDTSLQSSVTTENSDVEGNSVGSWAPDNCNRNREIASEKHWECDICDRKLKSKAALVSHKRTHFRDINRQSTNEKVATEKLWECDVCDRKLKSKSALVLHRQTHFRDHKSGSSSEDDGCGADNVQDGGGIQGVDIESAGGRYSLRQRPQQKSQMTTVDKDSEESSSSEDSSSDHSNYSKDGENASDDDDSSTHSNMSEEDDERFSEKSVKNTRKVVVQVAANMNGRMGMNCGDKEDFRGDPPHFQCYFCGLVLVSMELLHGHLEDCCLSSFEPDDASSDICEVAADGGTSCTMPVNKASGESCITNLTKTTSLGLQVEKQASHSHPRMPPTISSTDSTTIVQSGNTYVTPCNYNPATLMLTTENASNTSGPSIPLIISFTGSTTVVQSGYTYVIPSSYNPVSLLPTTQNVRNGSPIAVKKSGPLLPVNALRTPTSLSAASKPADQLVPEETVDGCVIVGANSSTGVERPAALVHLIQNHAGTPQCSVQTGNTPLRSIRLPKRTSQYRNLSGNWAAECVMPPPTNPFVHNIPLIIPTTDSKPVVQSGNTYITRSNYNPPTLLLKTQNALNTSGQNIPLVISSIGSTTAVQSRNMSTTPSASAPLLPTPQPVGSGSASGTVCLAQTSAPVSLLSDSTLTSAPEPADKPPQEKTVEQECSALPGGDASASGVTTCERNVLMGGTEGASQCDSEGNLSPSLRPSERTFQDCATAMNVPPVCALNTSGQNIPLIISCTGSTAAIQSRNMSTTPSAYTSTPLLPRPQLVGSGSAIGTVCLAQTSAPVTLLSDSTLTSPPEPSDKPAQEKTVEQECSALPGGDASASGVTTCERNVLMGGTEGASQCDSEGNLSPSLRPSERTFQDCATAMNVPPVCALNTSGQNIPLIISCTGSTAAIQSRNMSTTPSAYTSAPLLSTPQPVGSGSAIGTVCLAQTSAPVSLLSDSSLTSAPEPADKPAQQKTVEQECSALPGGDASASGVTTCERNVLMDGTEGASQCDSEGNLSPSLRPSERTFQDCATAMNVPPVCALNTSGQNIPLIISCTGSTAAIQSRNMSTTPSAYTSAPLLSTPQPVGSGSAIGTVCLAQTSAPVSLLSDSSLTSAPEPADKPAQQKTVEQECSALPGGDASASGVTPCETEGASQCSSERNLSPSLRPSERTFQDCATAMNVPPVCALNTSGQNIPLIISSTGSSTAVQSSNTSSVTPSYTSAPLLPTPQPVGSGSAIGTVCLAQTSAPVSLLSDSTLTSAPEPADKPPQEKTVEQECIFLAGGDALVSGVTPCETKGASQCDSEGNLSPSLRPSERTFQDCATAMNVPPVCALNTSGQNIPLIISCTGSTAAIQSRNMSTTPSAYTSAPLLSTPQPVGSGSAIGTVCLAQTSAPVSLLSDSTLTSAPEPADRPAQQKTVEQECSALPGGDALSSGVTTCERNVLMDGTEGASQCDSEGNLSPSLRPSERTFQDCATAMNVPPVCALNTSGQNIPLIISSTGSTTAVQSSNTSSVTPCYSSAPLLPTPQPVGSRSAIGTVCLAQTSAPVTLLSDSTLTSAPEPADRPAQQKTVEQECSALPGGDALSSGVTTCERNVLMDGTEGASQCDSEGNLSPSLRPSERPFQDCATAMNVPPVCSLNTSGQNIPLIISSTGSTTAVQSSNTSTPPSYTSTPLLPTPQRVGSGSAIGTVSLAQTSAPVTLLSDSTLTSAPEPADRPAQEKLVEQECVILDLQVGKQASNSPPRRPQMVPSSGSTTVVQSGNTNVTPSYYHHVPFQPRPQLVSHGSAINTVGFLFPLPPPLPTYPLHHRNITAVRNHMDKPVFTNKVPIPRLYRRGLAKCVKCGEKLRSTKDCFEHSKRHFSIRKVEESANGDVPSDLRAEDVKEIEGDLCPLCNKPLGVGGNLVDHVASHWPVSCDRCGARFKTEGGLNMHQKCCVVSPSTFWCPLCTDTGRHLKNLPDHILLHLKYICPMCCDCFRKKSQFVKHLTKHVDIEKDATISNSDPVTYIHTNSSPVKNRLDSHQGFNYRLSLHSTRGPLQEFECDKCKMKFARKKNLVYHFKKACFKELFVGTGIECEECGKEFAIASDLRRHRGKVHHKGSKEEARRNKKVVCDICGKFVRVHIFKMHTLRHGERKLSCDICGFAFHAKHNLEVHMRKHTGERPYKCEQCGDRFKTPGHLINHRETHKPHSERRRVVRRRPDDPPTRAPKIPN